MFSIRKWIVRSDPAIARYDGIDIQMTANKTDLKPELMITVTHADVNLIHADLDAEYVHTHLWSHTWGTLL